MVAGYQLPVAGCQLPVSRLPVATKFKGGFLSYYPPHSIRRLQVQDGHHFQLSVTPAKDLRARDVKPKWLGVTIHVPRTMFFDKPQHSSPRLTEVLRPWIFKVQRITPRTRDVPRFGGAVDVLRNPRLPSDISSFRLVPLIDLADSFIKKNGGIIAQQCSYF